MWAEKTEYFAAFPEIWRAELFFCIFTICPGKEKV
jgi:hypothetical protein